jgi:hypothetical protein
MGFNQSMLFFIFFRLGYFCLLFVFVFLFVSIVVINFEMLCAEKLHDVHVIW